MRRALVALTVTLTLAACSPYDMPAAGSESKPPTAFATTTTNASAPCDRACWHAIIERQKAERAWWAEVVAQQQRARDWRRLVAHLEAQRRATSGTHVHGIEVCNGRTLPTCAIVRRESRFDPNARNPRSSAWGLYQFLRGTWRGVCPEYPHGSASVAQQVECARRLWAGGRGASHWST